MNYLLLALAIFALLAGFVFSYRFVLWAIKKANFNSVIGAFAYALYGAALIAASAWLFALSGVTA